MSVDCGQRLNWLGSFLSEAVYVGDSEMTPIFVLRICWIERLKLPVVFRVFYTRLHSTVLGAQRLGLPSLEACRQVVLGTLYESDVPYKP